MPKSTSSSEEKRVMITGASGGLGKKVVERVRQAGWRPVLVGRDAERLAETHGRENAIIEADVSTPEGADEAMAACWSSYGAAESLVHCAGKVLIMPMHRTEENHYRECMRANADSAFFTLRAFVRRLREDKKGGSAVLVSTVASEIGVANHEAVACSKGAVSALARAAAATYAADGIRVNGVAPGLMNTPPMQDLLRSDTLRQAMSKQYPLGRYGEPEDAAAAILWLISKESAWVTGQIIGIDGGFTAVRPMVR